MVTKPYNKYVSQTKYNEKFKFRTDCLNLPWWNCIALLDSNRQSLDEVCSHLLLSRMVPQLLPQLLHEGHRSHPKTPQDSTATGTNSFAW